MLDVSCELEEGTRREKLHQWISIYEHNSGKEEPQTRKRLIALNLLRLASIKWGLLENDIRSKAWPILLKAYSRPDSDVKSVPLVLKDLPDKSVMENDLHRLFNAVKYNDADEKARDETAVRRVLFTILSENPQLHYYQGLHDIAYVCTKVCGEKTGKIVFESLCRYWLREYLSETLQPAEDACRMTHLIVSHVHPQLGEVLRDRAHDRGYFALSWILTMFTHVFISTSQARRIPRILDFLFATHPLILPPYIAASMVLKNADGLLQLAKKGGDHADFHQYLSNMPQASSLRKKYLIPLMRLLQLKVSTGSDFGEGFPSIREVFDAIRQAPPSIIFTAQRTTYTSVPHEIPDKSTTKRTQKGRMSSYIPHLDLFASRVIEDDNVPMKHGIIFFQVLLVGIVSVICVYAVSNHSRDACWIARGSQMVRIFADYLCEHLAVYYHPLSLYLKL